MAVGAVFLVLLVLTADSEIRLQETRETRATLVEVLAETQIILSYVEKEILLLDRMVLDSTLNKN